MSRLFPHAALLSRVIAERWQGLVGLLALTVVLTGLNALKPLHMDDTGFYRFAAQAATHPDTPYGFELIWNHRPRPAIEILAPPVLPYWWGLGIHLFGQQPLLWKLWLLPFSLLLVTALHRLLQRFVRHAVQPLLWLTVLSPAILPGFNLMSDIPALALTLSAIVVFLHAHDRGGLLGALLAGLVAGLAMQTKYTAFTLPVVFVLYALLCGRWPLGLLAALTALGVFVGWESWIVQREGASNFLCTCAYFQVLERSPWPRLGHLLLALPTLTGGLAPAVMLLGLAALGRSGWALRKAAAAVVLGYLLLISVPEPWTTFLHDAQSTKPVLTLENVIYGALGAGFGAVLVAVVCRLLRRPDVSSWEAPRPGRRVEWFLVLWFGVELAGYFALSPFPAARRVLNLLVLATLLVGRLAARRGRTLGPAVLPRWVIAGGIVFGLLVYAIDGRDARAQQSAAEEAARLAQANGKQGTDWFMGIWGFEFYAERAGLRPLVLGRSEIRTGDRLVVYDDYFFYQQPFAGHEPPLEEIAWVTVTGGFPLRTVVNYYSGATPLRHRPGPLASATIYKATADFVPAVPTRPER